MAALPQAAAKDADKDQLADMEVTLTIAALGRDLGCIAPTKARQIFWTNERHIKRRRYNPN
jgi:hypothetical protein